MSKLQLEYDIAQQSSQVDIVVEHIKLSDEDSAAFVSALERDKPVVLSEFQLKVLKRYGSMSAFCAAAASLNSVKGE